MARTATTDPFESEIEAARERLAETIDTMVFRANPRNMIKRELSRAAGFFVDENGAPRTDNVLRVAGAAAGFLTLVVIIRKVTR